MKAYHEIDVKLRDELAGDQFIKALDNVELALALKLKHSLPKTLDNAIQMAIDWQIAEKT